MSDSRGAAAWSLSSPSCFFFLSRVGSSFAPGVAPPPTTGVLGISCRGAGYRAAGRVEVDLCQDDDDVCQPDLLFLSRRHDEGSSSSSSSFLSSSGTGSLVPVVVVAAAAAAGVLFVLLSYRGDFSSVEPVGEHLVERGEEVRAVTRRGSYRYAAMAATAAAVAVTAVEVKNAFLSWRAWWAWPTRPAADVCAWWGKLNAAIKDTTTELKSDEASSQHNGNPLGAGSHFVPFKRKVVNKR